MAFSVRPQLLARRSIRTSAPPGCSSIVMYTQQKIILARQTMLTRVLALAVMCAVGHSRSIVVDGKEYYLHGDIMVPKQRKGAALSVTPLEDNTNLWPGGKVNYVIDTTIPSPDLALSADDAAIAHGIAHWEAKTCIRFTRCATEAACTKPYIKFVGAALGECTSPVGIDTWNENVNVVQMAKDCGFGTAIHEIGHSMGLTHEQMRKDRESYIRVNFSSVTEALASNFATLDADARDLGVYDYMSVMHYGPTAGSNTSTPAILTPHRTGQNQALSPGDLAAVKFLYNDCKATYAAPTCMASMDTGVTHLIPEGKAYLVEFDAQYSANIDIQYPGTVPSARVTTRIPAGMTTEGGVGYTTVSFVPSEEDAGKTYTMAASFAADGTSVTCSVTVKVAGSTAVCNGVAANDASVCSGRGTCVGELPYAPCTCNAQYGGLDCSGFSECPANYLETFEGLTLWDALPSVDVEQSGIVTDVRGRGTSSWRVGTAAAGVVGDTFDAFTQARKPKRVSIMLARAGSGSVTFLMQSAGTYESCIAVELSASVDASFDDGVTARLESVAEQFHSVDMHIDWTTSAVRVFVDGKFAMTRQMAGACAAEGLQEMSIAGSGWADDIGVWCTDYVMASGTATTISTTADIVNGGKSLVLTLQGGLGEWLDTDVAKEAILDGLVADGQSGGAKGWNALRTSIVTKNMVAVNGNTLTVTFNAVASFAPLFNEIVRMRLTAAMFKDGHVPASHGDEIVFAVPGASGRAPATTDPAVLNTVVPDTASPTQVPTSVPTSVPTAVPTQTPTSVPTSIPTSAPTVRSTPTQAPRTVAPATRTPVNIVPPPVTATPPKTSSPDDDDEDSVKELLLVLAVAVPTVLIIAIVVVYCAVSHSKGKGKSQTSPTQPDQEMVQRSFL